MSLLPIHLILILATWGSFLNFLAYRLVHDVPLSKLRSICPHCAYQIAWYDLVPILSWLLLRGKCRNCKQSISVLYPLIEIATIIVGLYLVYKVPTDCLFAYAIFISALLIVIRTDLQTMLISRFTTLFLIPFAFIFSLTHIGYSPLLPISILDSIKGAIFGYLLLYAINKIFLLLTKKQGMGQGDMDLLALIGAFTGIVGAWISLMIGSILGSIVGIILLYSNNSNLNTKIPFGPFLASSAIIYTLLQNQLLILLFR